MVPPLFTYGTLRVRQPNHHILKEAPLLHQACKSVKKFIMFTQRCKLYPFIIPPEYWPEKAHLATHVTGDVFRINKKQQKQCDILESHPDYYRRTILVFHISNAMIESDAYILTESSFKQMDLGQFIIIESGDWLKK